MQGSSGLALLAGLLLLGGLVLETRVLLRRRPDWYFRLGIPLGAQPEPIPTAPTGSGHTESVRWSTGPPGWVYFWADPAKRAAPTGLHGAVRLIAGTNGTGLQLSWSPPLTPLLAAAWLGALGVSRGEPIATAIGAGIAVALMVVYGDRARRCGAELRQSFVAN